MDTTFWQQQWNALVAAPVLSLFFLAIGAGAAWWLRGATVTGQLDGLKAQIDALKERVQLAADKLEERDDARKRLEEELRRLQQQLDTGASKREIVSTAASAKSLVETLDSQDAWFRNHLAPPDPWADDAAQKSQRDAIPIKG